MFNGVEEVHHNKMLIIRVCVHRIFAFDLPRDDEPNGGKGMCIYTGPPLDWLTKSAFKPLLNAEVAVIVRTFKYWSLVIRHEPFICTFFFAIRDILVFILMFYCANVFRIPDFNAVAFCLWCDQIARQVEYNWINK